MTKSKIWIHFEENKIDDTLAKCILCPTSQSDIKRGEYNWNFYSNFKFLFKLTELKKFNFIKNR